MPTYSFEVSFEEILNDQESYVDAVFSCLESEFLIMPKGAGFIEYPVFERGYEALKAATRGFTKFASTDVLPVVLREPISLVVLRTMLGFTPPEWGYVATQETGTVVAQGFVRSLDRKIRMAPETPISTNGVTIIRLEALVYTACKLLAKGVPEVDASQLHRLDKADTKSGTASISKLADLGAPYAMLLYERWFLTQIGA